MFEESKVGWVVDGKYELLKEVGRGGMSVVYLAVDRRLGKRWAVKAIRKARDSRTEELFVRSFLTEAHLMKGLDHPALPRIVDIIDEGGSIFVVMDFIEGESLDRILEREGAQREERVVEWGKQICGALKYLHSRKLPIIYRDMKPGNVMLGAEGKIKIVDFGVAREYKAEQQVDTAVLGTQGYASPEHYGARQTDVRSDIFTLGMTMHHLLTGKDPRRTGYRYAPIRQWRGELSEGLERIIEKCTALDPKARYQSCGELLAALELHDVAACFDKKTQNGLKRRIAGAVLAAVLVGLGIVGKGLLVYVDREAYEERIAISGSLPYEMRVQAYLEAIDLSGADIRAYMKLLEAYQENGVFGDSESGQFAGRYHENKAMFDTATAEYLDLAYEAGITYFYLYSGGDQSFRSRILKAYHYFRTVVESGNRGFEYYDTAESYCIIGDFYTQYVVNAARVKEPESEAYLELLASLQMCIDNMERYERDDAAYMKLTMYREIVNLINDHRQGFAAARVEQDSVLQILHTIYSRTEELSITQQDSVELRDAILGSADEYIENIERSYVNHPLLKP